MHVFIIASLTVDGFIAQEKEQSSLKWTSKEDTKFFVQKTKSAGVMIMGATTFATINRPLPERQIIVYSRVSEGYDQFNPSEVRATQLEPSALLEELERAGFSQVAICGGSSIYTMFMQAGLVDQLFLTVEPVLFGQGIPLFNAPLDVRLRLNQVIDLSEQTKVFEYQVVK